MGVELEERNHLEVSVGKARSAGILLYQVADGGVRVLLGHMGGPYWAKKDVGGWSLPKGEYIDGEDPFEVAKREFEEELGSPVPASDFISLGDAKQPSGKVVTIWACEGPFNAQSAVSNTFEMEWPRGSGKMAEFPEVDRAEWFSVREAREKVLKGHRVFLDRLMNELRASSPELGEHADPGDGQEALF